MTMKRYWAFDTHLYTELFVPPEIIVAVFKAADVEQMVKDQQRTDVNPATNTNDLAAYTNGYVSACIDILARLKGE